MRISQKYNSIYLIASSVLLLSCIFSTYVTNPMIYFLLFLLKEKIKNSEKKVFYVFLHIYQLWHSSFLPEYPGFHPVTFSFSLNNYL